MVILWLLQVNHVFLVVFVVKPWLIFIRANYLYVVALSHEIELDWDAFEGQLLM